MKHVMMLCSVSVAATALAQPLPTDDRLTRGTLDNGLQYIILPHDVPKGRVELYIHMDTGSLNETEKQRGIAHYLEHVAFNGSTNFEPGALIPLFQSQGLQFGRDQNAYTNMQETVFQLSLPDTDPTLLGKSLLFFSDVVGRLSLTPKEIDSERQIIQEERRRSLSGQRRAGDAVIERMIPGSIYGQRLTIGTEGTINSVQQQDFRDYYGTYYTASNAVLMVVGDVKPEEIVPEIKKAFGDLPKKPVPTHQELGVKAQSKPYAIVVTDPEITAANIEISRVDVPRGPAATVPQFRVELIERLSESCFNNRMQDKVSRGGTSYQRLNASMGDSSKAVRESGVSAGCEPAKWKEALSDLAMELQRARTFGFTSREVENAKKRLMAGAERAVKSEATTPSKGLIGRLNRDVGAGEPIMSPQQQLTLLQQLLPSITAEETAAYFAKEMEPKNVAIAAVLPSFTTDVPTEAKLLEMGLAALAVKPTPEAEAKLASSLMDTLPSPGKVAEENVHEATGAWNAWLSNGVRIHHKFMDERKDNVTISIALVGGELLETPANRGITSAAALPFGRHATSKLSSVDIHELMNGKKVVVGGGGGGGPRGGGGGASLADGLRLIIAGSPDDLESGMQVAYLMLTDPKIEEAAFTQWKTQQVQAIEGSMKNPQRYAQRMMARTIFPETDCRVQPLTVEQVNRLDLASAQAWLNKLIATSPIEVTIVGDLPREKAIELVDRYLGSLPPRERISAHTLEKQRHIARPQGPRTTQVAIKTETPQAFVMCGFYGANEQDVPDVRALSMASRILSTRMIKEVREEAQLVYSIGAASAPASTYPGFGLVQAGATTEPHKVEALVKKLNDMYAAFAKDGCTEEELVTAKLQFAKTFEEQYKEPAFWQTRLDQAEFRATNLDEIMKAPDAYQAMTAQQVKDAFTKYYSPATTLVVAVKPETVKTAGAEAASEK